MSKRENYISWNEYFMEIAKLSAKRSKDPKAERSATPSQAIIGRR